VGSNPIHHTIHHTIVISRDIGMTRTHVVRGACVLRGFGVEGQLAQEFAGGGVDDADVQVLDEQDDVGSGVGPADADVVELAAVAEGDAAGGVDDVAADAVVGVGGPAATRRRVVRTGPGGRAACVTGGNLRAPQRAAMAAGLAHAQEAAPDGPNPRGSHSLHRPAPARPRPRPEPATRAGAGPTQAWIPNIALRALAPQPAT
jgi:hypothetical protein